MNDGTARTRSTTVVAIHRNGRVAMAADGQVTVGQMVMKQKAEKVRKIAGGRAVVGFAGGAADALTLLERLGFELFANELLHEDESGTLQVINGLEEFREHLGGDLTITLLCELGQGFEVHEMNLPIVVESIYELRDRQAGRVQTGIPARA